MCLGIPGRVDRWVDSDSEFASAMIDFGGVKREIQMACVPEANVDDYVIVHAGVAICVINQSEADKTLQELKRLGELGEFEPIQGGSDP